MTLKKYFSKSLIMIAALSLFLPQMALGQATSESDFFDESLNDISVVLGAGAAGAVLGLSTLSFVEEPSKHLKNIAVGGAVGIVVGVGYVIFSQASRSTTAIGKQAQVPMNPEKFNTVTRQEFSQNRIVQTSQVPSLGYNFSF